jgi:hypothetical protein
MNTSEDRSSDTVQEKSEGRETLSDERKEHLGEEDLPRQSESSCGPVKKFLKEYTNEAKHPFVGGVLVYLILTVVFTALTYGSARFIHDIGLPVTVAALFVIPLAGIASYVGTKALNRLFAYIVAALKGEL